MKNKTGNTKLKWIGIWLESLLLLFNITCNTSMWWIFTQWILNIVLIPTDIKLSTLIIFNIWVSVFCLFSFGFFSQICTLKHCICHQIYTRKSKNTEERNVKIIKQLKDCNKHPSHSHNHSFFAHLIWLSSVYLLCVCVCHWKCITLQCTLIIR